MVEILWLLACGDAPTSPVAREPLAQEVGIANMTNDEARQHVAFLERWAVVGRAPSYAVHSVAMHALGESSDPAAVAFLEHELDGPRRLSALSALGFHRAPEACALLVRRYAAGPDEDPAFEAALEREIGPSGFVSPVRGSWPCREALEAQQDASPRVRSLYTRGLGP